MMEWYRQYRRKVKSLWRHVHLMLMKNRKGLFVSVVLLVILGAVFSTPQRRFVTDILPSSVTSEGRQRYENLVSADVADGANFYTSIYLALKEKPKQELNQSLASELGISLRNTLIRPDADDSLDAFTDRILGIGRLWNNQTAKVDLNNEDTLGMCRRSFIAGRANKTRDRWKVLKERIHELRPTYVREAGFIDVADVLKQAQQQEQVDIESVLSVRFKENEHFVECIDTIQKTIAYEQELSEIFVPLERRLEMMQAFSNGRLDDFMGGGGAGVGLQGAWSESVLDFGLPKFDLVFDLDVIDKILFATAVTTGLPYEGSPFDRKGDGGGGSDDDASSPPASGNTSVNDPNRELPGSSSGTGGDPNPNPQSQTGGSGLGGSGAGPNGVLPNPQTGEGAVCEYFDGVQLDLSEVVTNAAGGTAPPAESGSPNPATYPNDPRVNMAAEQKPSLLDIAGEDSDERFLDQFFDDARSAVRDGGSAEECSFKEGDFFSYLFCVLVDFEKRGKTWTVQKDDCIACHVREINKIFEDELLSSSLLPHKNPGMMFESGLCQDAFGSDLDLRIKVEYVPMQFYNDACYPEGGWNKEVALLRNGVPELAKVLEAGKSVSCNGAFDKDKGAADKCIAYLGQNEVSYESFATNYRIRSELWEKLVGEEGVVRRAVHDFLARNGIEDPKHGEAETADSRSLYKLPDGDNSREYETYYYDYSDADRIRLLSAELKFTQTMNYVARKEILTNQVLKLNEIPESDSRHAGAQKLLVCLQGNALSSNDIEDINDELDSSGGASTRLGSQRRVGSALAAGGFVSAEYCKSMLVPDGQEYDNFARLENDIFKERIAVRKLLREWGEDAREFNSRQSCSKFASQVDIVKNFIDDRIHDLTKGIAVPDEGSSDSVENQQADVVVKTLEYKDIEDIFSRVDKKVVEGQQEARKTLEEYRNDIVGLTTFDRYSDLKQEMIQMQALMKALKGKWNELTDRETPSQNGGGKINYVERLLEKAR